MEWVAGIYIGIALVVFMISVTHEMLDSRIYLQPKTLWEVICGSWHTVVFAVAWPFFLVTCLISAFLSFLFNLDR